MKRNITKQLLRVRDSKSIRAAMSPTQMAN